MDNIAGFLTLFVLSLVLTFATWAALSPSLRGLLDQVLKLPDGTTFYLRTLLVGLLLGAAAGIVNTTFDLKPGSAFMEYVWRTASGLEDVLQFFFGFILVYLLLVTILVAVLRPRHE
jgi:hypothetical protein